MAHVVIDPGHGGSTPCGRSTPYGGRGAFGALEKDLNLRLARRVALCLETRSGGIPVVLTRDDDRNLSLGERATIARRAGAQIFVSLHGGQPSAGPEAWVHTRADPHSRALARAIQSELDLLGRSGMVQTGDLALLTPELFGTETCSCLIEAGTLHDPTDPNSLLSESHTSAVAGRVARGISKFMHSRVSAGGVAQVAYAQSQSFDVDHDVQLVPQPTNVTCWAAAAAMVVGWRDRMSIDPSELSDGTGPWGRYKARGGLHAEDFDAFRQAWDLRSEGLATWTVDGFRDLLQMHGPLWVAARFPSRHVVVVSGIYGDGSLDGTHVRIKDPWPPGVGSSATMTVRQLATAIEATAVVRGLEMQILHA